MTLLETVPHPFSTSSMSDPYTSIAKNIRQWFREDRPHATSYAYAMTEPKVLAPFLEKVYARLLRNRKHFLELQHAGWARDEPFYKWLLRYFDMTDPQNPDKRSLVTGRPQPLQSVQEGLMHLQHVFDTEFAAQDTMLIREKDRLETYMAMNGDDNDCHWSYTGPGGGQHLYSINTKSVGYDGVSHDTLENKLWYQRHRQQDPTAMYGAVFTQQKAIAYNRMDADVRGSASNAWLGF